MHNNTDIEQAIKTFFLNHSSYIYKKKEIILSADNAIDYIYYVKNGALIRYLINTNGDLFTLYWIKQNNFFPQEIFQMEKNSYYYQALTTAEIIRVPTKKFEDFLSYRTDCREYLLSKRIKEIGNMNKHIEQLLLERSTQKKLEYLILKLANLFGKQMESQTVIDIILSHAEMASFIGTTRESVTRALARLKKAGLISVKEGHLIATDLSIFRQRC